MCSSSVVVDEAAVVLVVMMKGARVLVKVICVLTVALAAAELQMDVEYPDGTSNRNRVRLICRNEITLRRVSDARFQKYVTFLTQGSASIQVTTLVEGDGEVTFTFTQAQEGLFRCVHNDEESEWIGLTGNDSGCVCCLCATVKNK